MLRKNEALTVPYVTCNTSDIKIVDANASSYFRDLEEFKEIHTLFLVDSMINIDRYFRATYYDYMSNDCSLLEKNSKGGNYLGRTRYGAECKGSFNETWQGHPLNDIALRWGLPEVDTNLTSEGKLLTFIHLLPNAVALADGDVIHGNVRIVPMKCKRNLSKSCRKVRGGSKRYREVFSISQFWGAGFFHSTLEVLPRIAPYLPFLNKYKHIVIHVPAKVNFLNLLGIDQNRLIISSAVHADLLYMPAGSPCGSPTLFATQMLARAMANFPNASTVKPDKIILIKRSHKRWFDNHASILAMLRTHASRRNLTVEVFNDNPLPSIAETVEMFRRALIVVAPHGAGESNMIFSQPGTLLIEGLCYDSDKKTNLCYRNMAQALGLRYYGLIYKHQCMKIMPTDIERPLLEYFQQRDYYGDIATS